MNVLVVGKGKSGKAAFSLLKKQGVNVLFADEKIVNADKTESLKIDYDRLLHGLSFIVTSPGISLDLPFFKEVRKRKIKLIGELELGAVLCKGKIIAITGTNGKTTTVSLIHHLLGGLKQNVFLGGNIGIPICMFVEKTQPNDIVVLECSSYQLESVEKFKPHIAAILNVTEDHLTRHKTMKKYLKAKLKIAKNLTENDYLIINADDEFLMQNLPKTDAKIFFFSTKNKVVGCYKERNSIYFNDNLNKIRLLSLRDVKLVGEHNVSNVLCAVLAVFLLIKNKKCFEKIKTFYGVEHRIEYIKTIKNVSFYNDSKATNIDSTIVALKSFNCKINLILGGSDKGFGFDKLFENLPKNVKNIAIFGQTKRKIAFFAEKHGYKNYVVCETFKAAVLNCYEKAEANEIVLLSPACASFDMFKNFEERGSVFKKIVEEIFQNETANFESSKKT